MTLGVKLVITLCHCSNIVSVNLPYLSFLQVLHVLDAGCGTGNNAVSLINCYIKVGCNLDVM